MKKMLNSRILSNNNFKKKSVTFTQLQGGRQKPRHWLPCQCPLGVAAASLVSTFNPKVPSSKNISYLFLS